MRHDHAPQKIAVLGGGLGALSAVYALTLVPGWRERFEVDVFQAGWRLGGKGASGRNAQRGERIEEHGLHVWLGFYQNAFAMLQHCYRALASVAEREGSSPPASFFEAFERHSEISVMEGRPPQQREIRLRFPDSPSTPGGTRPRLLPGPRHYAAVATGALRALWSSCRREGVGAKLRRLRRVLVAELAVKRRSVGGEPPDTVPPSLAHDDQARDLFQLVDLFATMALGLTVELGLRRKRLDDLDDEEFLEWLTKWGAAPLTLRSPLVRGIYDMGFAFDEGDTERPNFAAGAFIRATLRILLTYEGAIFWKMQGGMGDVVFAPLYRVLRARGVRFHFFHRVDRIDAAHDGSHVQRIVLTRQARPRCGEYRPLREVHGVPCWPSEPDFEQLEHGERLRAYVRWFEDPRVDGPDPEPAPITLEHRRDFDQVVLGIPVAALRTIATSLARACPRFGRMLLHLQTVQTQAAQLWLRPRLEELGYSGAPPVLAGHVDPLNTWADMSHLIPHENWSPGELGSIAYYCGPKAGPEDPPVAASADEHAEVQRTTRAMLDAKVCTLWPGARGADGGFDAPRVLVDRRGGSPLGDQYFRVNSAPSERYVLTAAGTTRFRLAPDDSGFDNLYLCGDWTRNDFNTGCVEATVMSGLEAARALARHPFHIVGARRGPWSSRTSLWERRSRP